MARSLFALALALLAPAAAAQRYATTCVAEYGACVDYPAGLYAPDPRQSDDRWRGLVDPADPADPDFRLDLVGMRYRRGDGGHPFGRGAFEALYRDRLRHLAGDEHVEVTYRHLDRQRRFFVVSGVDRAGAGGAVVFYARYLRSPDGFVVADLRYPLAEKDAMDPHVTRISRSLRFESDPR